LGGEGDYEEEEKFFNYTFLLSKSEAIPKEILHYKGQIIIYSDNPDGYGYTQFCDHLARQLRKRGQFDWNFQFEV